MLRHTSAPGAGRQRSAGGPLRRCARHVALVALPLAATLTGCTAGTTAEPISGSAVLQSSIDEHRAAVPDGFDSAAFRGPLTITEGGTYSGAYVSGDPETAAVTVKTTEPVVIDDATLIGRGHLIVEDIEGVDLTVRNTSALGLNPDRDGAAVGRFISVERPARLIVEDNALTSTAGISVLKFRRGGSSGETIRIVRNEATNIDGRVSNGSGRAGPAGFYGEENVRLVQFVQLDKVRNVPGIEIAWNKVRNSPDVSRVEDNISIYLSRGMPDSPIRIHDNLIDGAYPLNPRNSDYAGGGIMLGDGNGDRASVPAYVEATNNTVLNTSNYGIATSAGHNIHMQGNRVLSTGRLPGGAFIASQNVGIYVWNLHGEPTTFFNNTATGNVVGWERPTESRRNDFYFPERDQGDANRSHPRQVTRQTLIAERRQWHERARAVGFKAERAEASIG